MDRFRLRQYTYAITGGAASYAEHVCAQGVAELIICAWGTHDDIAARNCNFGYIDTLGGTATDMSDTTSKAAGAFLHLYDSVKCPEAIIMRYGHTLRFNVGSLDFAGGKRATMHLIVEQLAGDESYGA